MTRHTSMPPRLQKTPHGDVTLTSRWMRDRYYLVATGAPAGLRWLFPRRATEALESISPVTARIVFPPCQQPITVERTLRQICTQWQQAWQERLAEPAVGQLPPDMGSAPSPPGRLVAAIEAYLSLRAGELASSTLERNRHYLMRWLQVLGGDGQLADLTEERLVAARTHLAETLKSSTVNCMIATFRTFLRWAEERDMPVNKAYRRLKRVRDRAPHREKAWWTPEEIDGALVAAAEVDAELQAAKKRGRWRENPTEVGVLLVSLGCLLGLRYEEIIMLRWEDIDLDRRDGRTGEPAPVVHIRPKAGWMPKDGEARSIPMHHRLVEILDPRRQPSGWVLNSHKAMPKRAGTKRVYRYDPKKVWNRVLARAQERGAKAITPHGMRHSFASNLLMAGVSDVLIARWLGHADTAMVHQHYGHLLAYHGDINRVRIGPSRPSPVAG